jgi:O-antigen/teichoic acid export membrane protein
MGLGPRGWLVALVAANAVTFLATAVLVPWDMRRRYDRFLVARSVRFGLPMLPHMMSQWALQLADRAVLAGLVTSAELGIYSLAANFALPVMIAVGSLNQGMMPTYARYGTGEVGVAQIQGTIRIQVALVCLVTAAAALLGPPILGLVAPPDFGDAAAVLPWLVAGYGLLGLYYIPMNGATLADGRSRFAWTATALSAATNIALLYALVPTIGIEAAGASSTAGYAALLAGIQFYASRGQTLPYPYRSLALLLAGSSAVYVSAIVTTPSTGATSLVARCAWLIPLVAIAVLATRHHREPRDGRRECEFVDRAGTS